MKYNLSNELEIYTSEFEIEIKELLDKYNLSYNELKDTLSFDFKKNIMTSNFSDDDLINIIVFNTENLEEKRKECLDKDIIIEVNNGIDNLKNIISKYQTIKANKKEFEKEIKKNQDFLIKDIKNDIKKIEDLVSKVIKYDSLLTKCFKGYKEPNRFKIIFENNDFSILKKGDIIYFPYYKRANPKINLNIGIDKNTMKDYYLSKIENINKDSDKSFTKFKYPDYNNKQSIFKVIEANKKVMKLRRIIITDKGYIPITEEIELNLNENNQYIGAFLYSDSRSKITEIKESVPFEDILDSLTKFAQDKQSYQLEPNSIHDGSYRNKDNVYGLYSSSKFDINTKVRDFSNYKLIERIKINDFLKRFREISQIILKKKNLNSLDYYSIKIVYKESIYSLDYIYNILNNLKQANVNEVDFLSSGKYDEANLVIKDSTWFIEYCQSPFFDNHYKYLDWITLKDMSIIIDKLSQIAKKEFIEQEEKEHAERIKQWKQREEEKESKSEKTEEEIIKEMLIKENLVKKSIEETKIIKSSKEKTKSKKEIKYEKKWLFKNNKYEISISQTNEKFIVFLLFKSSGINRIKEFYSKNDVTEYLKDKKIENKKIIEFQSFF